MYPKVKLVVLVFAFLSATKTIHASDPDPPQDFCLPNNNTTATTSIPCKNSSLATPDDFVFSGIKKAGTFSASGFAGISVTAAAFPGLNTLGISFARADLRAGGLNPPHLHPRATEVAYVTRGIVYSGFVDSANRVFAKLLEAGEVMVYPRGLIHFQLNVGRSTATIIGSFNSQNPGTQRIPNALFGSDLKDEVLEKAFGLTATEIARIRAKFLPKRG